METATVRKYGMYGKKHSKESRAKMILSASKRKRSPMPEETKAKISKANKGKPKSAEHRRKIGVANSKRIVKESTKQKISKFNIGRLAGSKNPSWKGGISIISERIRQSFKYRQWRSDVFTRDKYTCQRCNIVGGKLEAHHIKRFSKVIKDNNIKTMEQAIECEELWNINNGETLCYECHKLTDNYGRPKK